MKNGTPVIDLNQLLEAALNGRPYNQLRLGKQAQRYAASISWRMAPDLPEDLHGEVFSEAFTLLLEAGSAALANKNCKDLFAGCVRNAVRRVQASNASPGQRTRKPARKAPPPKGRVAAEHVERVLDPKAVERLSTGEGNRRLLDFDNLPDPVGEARLRRVEHRIDIQKLFVIAPAVVERSYRAIHLEGISMEAAAQQAGIKRFTLRRQFLAFSEIARAAA